jgi:type IV secretory pathway TraG/TraD family ATPase VirD4
VPRLRKFGGRCVLGFQSIAQVSSTYGKGAADTIVENCANTLILLCSASEHGGTSEFASRLIGQREVTHTTQSTSRRPGEWRRSTTMSEQVNIEPAVMASEIERLPDLPAGPACIRPAIEIKESEIANVISRIPPRRGRSARLV